jgi:predicted nucleic acid-binding protein
MLKKKNPMLKTRYVFLDANIYVQYLPYYKAETLLHKLQTIKIIVCDELLTEIERVAAYPFIINRIPINEQDNYLQYVQKVLLKLMAFADIYINQPIPMLIEEPANDPNDWYISNICTQYNCTLVTADNDFLKWSTAPFPILTPAEFFKGLT